MTFRLSTKVTMSVPLNLLHIWQMDKMSLMGIKPWHGARVPILSSTRWPTETDTFSYRKRATTTSIPRFPSLIEKCFTTVLSVKLHATMGKAFPSCNQENTQRRPPICNQTVTWAGYFSSAKMTQFSWKWATPHAFRGTDHTRTYSVHIWFKYHVSSLLCMQEWVKWFSGEEVMVRVTLCISVVMFGNHKNAFQNRILPCLWTLWKYLSKIYSKKQIHCLVSVVFILM